MIVAYIGLGSNLDRPQDQLRRAVDELAELPASRLTGVSSFYGSAPLGLADQPDFINAVAALETELDPHALLSGLQAIEQAHGRRRERHWGPRTLDLDLLLYGDRISNTAELQVPHPGLYARNFVLYPLHEIAPQLNIPGHGPLADLLTACSRQGLWKLDDQDRTPAFVTV
jgi:2-amino-4-hydroxy-6-hydroxymethyldihydropteridine diphosphokinase